MFAYLFLILFFLFVPFANAATTVYVDDNGVCGGLNPCYTTIQAGVNNAGGGSSTVHVFPGTYNESVDLSLMGSSDGAQDDLTLQTVNASGVYTPGTATVSPGSGEAFWNSVDPFPGNLVFSGFNVTSPDTDAIDLEGVSGTVDMNDLTATDAFYDGVDIRADGSVTIMRSTASDNGNDGFQILVEGVGNVLIEDSFAERNADDNEDGDDGFNILLTDGSLTLRRSQANDNGTEGFEAHVTDGGSISGVTIEDCFALRNGLSQSSSGDGFQIETDGEETLGSVSIINTRSEDNSGDGFEIQGISGTLTILDSHASGNELEGFEMEAAENNIISQVTVTNSVANDNGTVDEGSGDGFYIEAMSNGRRIGDVTITNCQALRNTGDGFEIQNEGQLIMTDVTANGNGINSGDGMDLGQENDEDRPSYVELTRVTANDNYDEGIQVQAFGNIDVFSSITNGNGMGPEATGSEDGMDLVTIEGSDGNVTVIGCQASNNLDDGVDINADGDVEVSGCTTNNNGEDGVDVTETDSDEPAGDITSDTTRNDSVFISSVSAEDNGDDGIDAGSTGPVTIHDVCVESQDDDGIVVKQTDGDLEILRANVLDNTDDGIDLIDISNGTFTIADSNIDGNGDGVVNDQNDVTVDAGGNWWGSPNGPTTPNNPGGTGDTAVDEDNGGAGNVLFAGFLSTMSPLPPICEFLAIPTLSTLGYGALLLLMLAGGYWMLSVRKKRQAGVR